MTEPTNQTDVLLVGAGPVAAPDRRLVFVTGEGSHQLTAQEISQFGRRGLKPVRTQQRWLSDRTTPLQESRVCLQRSGFMAVLGISARVWLRRLVHASRYHMRRI
jgi:hypothetical protein